MKIYTPVKNATGVWCSVHFRNGVGETDNPNLIKWFKEHGYRVEEPIKLDEGLLDNVLVNIDESVTDFESMTPNDLREWAKAHGLGGKIKGIRNKEKLLEIVRG
jgi:hypothetical protein